MTPAATHLANDNRSGMDAKTHRQLDAFLLLQARVERRGNGLDNPETCLLYTSDAADE